MQLPNWIFLNNWLTLYKVVILKKDEYNFHEDYLFVALLPWVKPHDFPMTFFFYFQESTTYGTLKENHLPVPRREGLRRTT